MKTLSKLLPLLLLFLVSVRLTAQLPPSPAPTPVETPTDRAQKALAQYRELCSICQKTLGVAQPHLSPADLELARYWLTHQPDEDPATPYDGRFTRVAATTLGNVRDAQSYETLEKIYLDPKQTGGFVREEAFHAIAKIDPNRAAHHVLKELATGDVPFAVAAGDILKESYGTSFEAMQTNMGKRFLNLED